MIGFVADGTKYCRCHFRGPRHEAKAIHAMSVLQSAKSVESAVIELEMDLVKPLKKAVGANSTGDLPGKGQGFDFFSLRLRRQQRLLLPNGRVEMQECMPCKFRLAGSWTVSMSVSAGPQAPPPQFTRYISEHGGRACKGPSRRTVSGVGFWTTNPLARLPDPCRLSTGIDQKRILPPLIGHTLTGRSYRLDKQGDW